MHEHSRYLMTSLTKKKKNKKGHIPFTTDEIDKLWKHVDDIQYVNVVLVQCCSGWRPQELGLIEMKNVDLDQWLFVGGMKTDAGMNRTVPIHPIIRPLVKKLHDEAIMLGSEYLINCTDTKTHRSSLKFTYDKYQKRFAKIRDRLELNPDHRPHDPRKHFVTLAKKYNVDEYAIKYMVGHSISDITEKVYTERDVEWLTSEMNKIQQTIQM